MSEVGNRPSLVAENRAVEIKTIEKRSAAPRYKVSAKKPQSKKSALGVISAVLLSTAILGGAAVTYRLKPELFTAGAGDFTASISGKRAVEVNAEQAMPDAIQTQLAQAQKAGAKPNPNVAKPTPAGATAPGEEPITLQHAKNNGVTACAERLRSLTGQAIDTPVNSAFSIWSSTRPNERMFQSVLGLHYPKAPAASHAASIINVSPLAGGGCDGSMVQVYPSTNSCQVLMDGLNKQGYQKIGDIAGMPVMQNTVGVRTMLIPNGKSCVITAVSVLTTP